MYRRELCCALLRKSQLPQTDPRDAVRYAHRVVYTEWADAQCHKLTVVTRNNWSSYQ